ncbi:MAG: hypothetical protein KC776_22365, partial [Myxococcales bacterium]|nr:hypothetical protein [Myxococcales bacterium]
GAAGGTAGASGAPSCQELAACAKSFPDYVSSESAAALNLSGPLDVPCSFIDPSFPDQPGTCADGYGCGPTTACCNLLSAAEQPACLTQYAQGDDASCGSTLGALHAQNICVGGWDQDWCGKLSACCPTLPDPPNDPNSPALHCTQTTSAADPHACLTVLLGELMAGFCNG